MHFFGQLSEYKGAPFYPRTRITTGTIPISTQRVVVVRSPPSYPALSAAHAVEAVVHFGHHAATPPPPTRAQSGGAYTTHTHTSSPGGGGSQQVYNVGSAHAWRRSMTNRAGAGRGQRKTHAAAPRFPLAPGRMRPHKQGEAPKTRRASSIEHRRAPGARPHTDGEPRHVPALAPNKSMALPRSAAPHGDGEPRAPAEWAASTRRPRRGGGSPAPSG